MSFTTILSVDELKQHLDAPNWAIIDCRFNLEDAAQGRQLYEQAHIPGAVYAHLNDDLAAPPQPDSTGMHPLPDSETFAQKLGGWGIDEQVQLVAYDDWGGALAARLWWMLRWLGHDAVAVLDGGWPAWERAGLPARSGEETRPPRTFTPRPRPELVVNTADVQQHLFDQGFRLFDSRPPEMYRGETAMGDLPAGRIPGALSMPFAHNLDDQGYFLPPDELHVQYRMLLDNLPAENSAFYCVSGVTSAHNVLAAVHAGLGEPRLYVGSWSEWTADSQRPQERDVDAEGA